RPARPSAVSPPWAWSPWRRCSRPGGPRGPSLRRHCVRYRTGLLAARILRLPLAALAAAGIAWKPQFYNPTPLPKDLILPMPCGGAMVFRPVLVPADKLLGDRRITLGGPDDRFAFAESFRQDFLAGRFTAPGAQGGRLYYIGKYEVTVDQYATLAPDGCKPPSMLGRLPVTGISWNEAIDFSVHYTEWLYANAPSALPSEDGTRGYLRLPTEE